MRRYLPGVFLMGIAAILVWGCNGDMGPEPDPSVPQDVGSYEGEPGAEPVEPGSNRGGLGGGLPPGQPPRGQQFEMPAEPAPSPEAQSPPVFDPPEGGAPGVE